MSAADAKIVGTIRTRPVSTVNKNDRYHRCKWNLKGNFSPTEKEALHSRIFTIPWRKSCKFYFSIEPLNFKNDEGDLYFSVCLNLSAESECNVLIAKLKLDVYDDDTSVVEGLKCDSFKFTKEPKLIRSKKRGTVSISRPIVVWKIPSENLQRSDDDDDDDEEYNKLNVRCTIMLQKVELEDNSCSTDFGSLLKANLFTDVVLSVGGKKFPAHKCILATRSTVFASIFEQKKSKIVKIQDVAEKVFEQMLQYIYSGEVENLDNSAEDLLIAADKYDLKGLKIKCEDFLIEKLSKRNVIDMAVFADLYKADRLKYETGFIICNRRTKFLRGSRWKKLKELNAELAEKFSLCDFHPKVDEDDSDTENGSS